MNVTRTDNIMSRFESKWERIKMLEILLKKKKWKRTDLSKRLGVHRSTIGRYINEMSRIILIQEDEKGRVYIVNNN